MHFLPRMILVLGVLARVALAQDPALEEVDGSIPPSSLNYQTGVVELPGGMAQLELPDGFRYLDNVEGQAVLENLGGPPPGMTGEFQGLVIPPGEDPEAAGAWVMVLSFSKEGHVSDEDMPQFKGLARLDSEPDLFLEYLKRQNAELNVARKKQRLPALDLVGWGTFPRYSKKDKILALSKRYWNERARKGEESALVTELWVLGRRGKIIVGMIAPTDRGNALSGLGSEKYATMIHFNPGHRHEDFDPKSDPQAKWPAELQLKEAVTETKSSFASEVKRKLPLLLLVLVAFAVKKGIDRFREA